MSDDTAWIENMLKQQEERQAKMTLSKDDVFGTYDSDQEKMVGGLVVAHGKHDEDIKCPIFGDTIPWKSVTIRCSAEQYDEVDYWCHWVHGGDCISEYQETNGFVYLRSDYMCW